MWSLKYSTNDLSTKQKQIMGMEGRLLFAGGGGKGQELKVGRELNLSRYS